ncbi:MAG: hypothetical protein BEN19_05315 [Epulopiscium sp. Nuni2H_MBin003]|nr:MAG: hypothetical protein BEN19_05315 [Epulopiscium sp. Nuni2H_MBin003]
MKTKFLAIILICGCTSVLGAGVKPEDEPAQVEGFAIPIQETYIGVEKAKEIALNDAKITLTEAVFEKTSLEVDDGKFEYKIEFKVGNVEYEYEIDAQTGKIVETEKDIDD